MKKELTTYGQTVLSRRMKEVVLPDETLSGLIDEMFDIMYREKGIGLAAPQIGLDMKLAVIDIGRRDVERLVLINPMIISRKGECVAEEGCLSIPGVSGNVMRSREVVVETWDTAGNRRTMKCVGLLARAVEHELDHLDGLLIIDRMSTVERSLMSSKLKKLKKKASRKS